VLTGLPNRMLLNDRLTEAIALARRHQKPLAVCFLDVDGFKRINDALGHAAGDQLLRSIASRLSGALRASDTVCRFGGDEFVIVLSEIEHADHASAVAAKLRDAAAGPHRIDGRDVAVTVSVGAAIFPDHGRDADTLIAHADAAMYEAKHAGLGHLRLFENAMAGPGG